MNSIRLLTEKHIALLRKNASAKHRSIYDYSIYNNIFFEDISLFLMDVPKGTKVLDFGCGRGTTSYILSNYGFDTVGLEISYTELSEKLTSYVFPEAKQQPLYDVTKKECRNKGQKLDFIFYDGKKLPFEDGTFDAVLAYAVLEHVENIEEILFELNRVLKKGGILFISRTPNKYSLLEHLASMLGMPAHDTLYSKAEIINLLKKFDFDIKSIEIIDFFPSNIPGDMNGIYQRLHTPIMLIEKMLRYTPFNLFAHHFRIICRKK